MSVFVVGSFITDLVARTERAPQAGETVRGLSFDTFLGGKGANQAIAAHRMNSVVTMVGCVGNDYFGKEFIEFFEKEGFDISYIKKSEHNKTGCSLVTVETSGQNRICMVPGANLDFTKEELSRLENKIKESNVVLTQCEMREDIVEVLAELCKKFNKKFILNPAPARHLSDRILSCVDILTPNETELGLILGKQLVTDDDYINASKTLLAKGVKNVVVTLGSKGSLLVNSETAKFIPARKVEAIDTVGAGDAFTGSLSAFIDQGITIEKALKMSTAVSSLNVQRQGAIPSMPYRNEIDALLE